MCTFSPGRSLFLLILLMVGSCAVIQEVSPPPVQPVGGGSPAELAEIEAQVHQLINEHRTAQGLAPLVFSPAIAEIARGHSRAMAEQREPFGHGGFDERAEAIRRVVAYRALSENVAWNNHSRSATAEVAARGWIQSSGHRRNLEGPYTVTGIGVVRDARGAFHYTQIFVAR